jgi:hypothetical protein
MSPTPTTAKPLPIVEQLLSFALAMNEIKYGNKITKKEWNNPEIYGVLRDNLLLIHKLDNKFYNWIISDGDIMGEDYVTILN